MALQEFIKRVLLDEVQHRRLHSAFEKPFFTFVSEQKQKKQQEQEKISVTGVHTIEDCVLRSLLMINVTFLSSLSF